MTPSHPLRSIISGTNAPRTEQVFLDGARLLVVARYPGSDNRYDVLEERGLDDLRVVPSRAYSVAEIEDRLVEAWDRDAGEPHVPCRLAVELQTGFVIHQHST